MNQLQTILQPLSDELLYFPKQYSEITAHTRVEILDGQDILKTGILYIGTAKLVTAMLKAPPRVEQGCFLVVTNTARPLLQGTPFALRATCMEFRESLSRVFNHFSRAINDLLLTADKPTRSYEQFLDDIMNRRISSEAAIRQTLASFCPQIQSFYRIVLVRFIQEAEQEQIDLVLNELQELVPGLYMQKYHQELVGFYFHEDRLLTPPISDELNTALQNLMNEHHAEMSVGNATRHYDMVRTQIMLCSRIMTLGHALHLQDVGYIFNYERFSMYNVIDLAVQRYVEVYGHTDVIYLIHPAVVLLTRYDRTHNGVLRDTLYYYLLNDRNLVRTAKAVFMHRNTVVNKINKIVELTGVDLTDGGLCQRLIFSCQLIQYYERVMDMTLKQ